MDTSPSLAPRRDIQALRGLAVLLVVLYHTKLDFLMGGYLGVDIFFVISGFLITRLITADIERGDFRFSEFYFRRAKRLLPAAYVVFLATALIAPFVLGGKDLNDLAWQVLGAVTFSGNLVLWQQAGYFEGAGELKPLLHVWSLAIEEQYYFLLPATLVFFSPRRWLILAVLVFLTSLLLCVVGGFLKPIATFYLLPTRAWELAIGSIGAIAGQHLILQRAARIGFAPSIVALVVIPVSPIGGNHPGLDAFIVCLATLFVILRHSPRLNNNAAVRGLAPVGDMSYSLYLVHWPLFAFANNAWVGHPPGHIPLAVSLSLVAISFVLAYLLYRFVETPIRTAPIRYSPKIVARTVGVSFALVLGAAGIARASPRTVDFEHLNQVNYGLGEACEYRDSFSPRKECMTSDKPSVLVWGDSFAMHLVPGIVSSGSDRGIVQATRSACAPLLSRAPVEQKFRMGYNEAWAQRCIEFNDDVLRYLARTPTIEVVILASPFSAFVDDSNFANLVRYAAGFRREPIDPERAAIDLSKTILEIQNLGRRVVVVSPPPRGGFDIGRCHERLGEKRLMFGAPRNCEIPVATHLRISQNTSRFLEKVSVSSGTGLMRFDEFLCDDSTCKTWLGTVPLYRDSGHFSYAGSSALGIAANLSQRLNQLAR
jgi:peptidoglycan/LPS O-acetylase OafA/YrhL